MKNYNCPYCNNILYTGLGEKMIKLDVAYGSDFFDCPFCKKEYKLVFIENSLIKTIKMNRVQEEMEMKAQNIIEDAWKKNPNNAKPELFKVYIQCITDVTYNNWFNANKVIAKKCNEPDDIISPSIQEAALKIFRKVKNIKALKFLCYSNDFADLPWISIQTVTNKPAKTSVVYKGFPSLGRLVINPIAFDQEVLTKITRQEVPFFYDLRKPVCNQNSFLVFVQAHA